MLEMWERVVYQGSRPLTWERSDDQGKTWELVEWAGGELPFLLLDTREITRELESFLNQADNVELLKPLAMRLDVEALVRAFKDAFQIVPDNAAKGETK